MVIFGAGASYGSRSIEWPDDDSGPRVLPRPPLTTGLFAEHFGEYAAKYPASRPEIVRLRQMLRERPQSPIEQEIGHLYASASTDPERARHLMGLRFYLADLVETEARKWWDLFHGFTFYADLLQRLGAWRSRSGEAIVLVTFNYDELLDRSIEAQAANWTLTTFESYIDRPDWRLYKLHGSTAWSRVVPTDRMWVGRDKMIAHADEIDVRGGHLIITKSGELEEAAKRRASLGDPRGPTAQIPGIAVPTNLKQMFECPTDHLQRFTEEIPSVDRLLTIGWRGAEPHAIELLAEHIRPGHELAICDVGEDNVTRIQLNLGLAGRRGRGLQGFLAGFEGLLRGDELERWLDRSIL